MEARQSICLLSREMYFRWSMSWCMSNTCNILDETNGIYLWTTSCSAQERCLRQGLGRRLTKTSFHNHYFLLFFDVLIFLALHNPQLDFTFTKNPAYLSYLV